MSRGLRSLTTLAALVVLATRGGAQQPAFPWSAEVRLTDHPDSSFSDWPASAPLAYARTRDCLHVIWRDFMLRTSDCLPDSESCWHYTHQIGWHAADWGAENGVANGTKGICVISGPNTRFWDNAGNIVVDGKGRAHFAWESAGEATMRVRYRWRDELSPSGDCRSFQTTAAEEGDSTCTLHGWSESREAVVSPLDRGSFNPVLLITRPDFNADPDTSEVVHLFYHRHIYFGNTVSRAVHRWRTVGNPQNGWTMGPWMPAGPDSESVILETTTAGGIRSVSGAIDATTGRLYVVYQLDIGGAITHHVGTAAGPGLPWTTTQVGPSAGWEQVPEQAPVIAGGRDGRAYVMWSECQFCDDEDPDFQARVVLRMKDGSSPWGPTVIVSSSSLEWGSGDPHATRPHFTVRETPISSEVHVVWTQGKGTQRKIMHRYLSTGGDPETQQDWSEMAAIVDTGSGVSGAKIHSDGGLLFVQWQDFRHNVPGSFSTEMYHRWGPDATTGIAEIESAGGATGFRGFFPTPFRTETVGRLTIGSEDQGGRVVVAIYDVSGRRVREMVKPGAAAGTYEVHWDGRDQSGDRVGAGLYFVRVAVGEKLSHQGKLVYLR